MKKVIKKYMTVVVAVMLVIGFSAFKVVEIDTVELGLIPTVDENNQPIIEYINLDQMQEGEDYNCDPSADICTERYDVNDLDEDGLPKEGASPVSHKAGSFVLL